MGAKLVVERDGAGKFLPGHKSYGLTHGMCGISEYAIWAMMLQRCHRPDCPSFRNYGARGIAVCDEWRASFEAFFSYVGPRPSQKHSLDRIDNDGNYEPGNVRWATSSEQNRNRRNNHWVEWNDRRMLLSDWARELGISCGNLISRLSRFPLDIALGLRRIPYSIRLANVKRATHCGSGHEFTKENTILKFPSGRECRICHNARNKEASRRRRAAKNPAR